MSTLESYLKECSERDRLRKSGGAVYPPAVCPSGQMARERGINRRDLGAIEMAAALVPLYADSTWPPEKVAEEIAKAAYLISDALIKEGKK